MKDDNVQNEQTQELEQEHEELKNSVMLHITTTLSKDMEFLDKINRITFGLINGKSQIKSKD